MSNADSANATAASSPCIGVCTTDSDGVCMGCFRSRDEIAAWGGMSEAQRRHVMEHVLPLRRERYFD